MSDALLDRLAVDVAGGFVTEDEIVARLPDPIFASLYAYVDERIRILPFEWRKRRPHSG